MIRLRDRRSLLGSGVLTVLGMMAYGLFAAVGCLVPWWYLTVGLPFFGFAFSYARMDRATDLDWMDRGLHYAALATAAFFFVLESSLAGAALVRDVEEYGTGLRVDCGDTGDRVYERTAQAR